MARREQIWRRPRPVLTCPFCGGDDTVIAALASRDKDDVHRHYAVMCRNCKARGPVEGSPGDANERWREREASK